MSAVQPSLHFIDSVAVTRVRGPDARSFLHALLTQDLRTLEPGAATLAAWLDPRGRVLACFDVIAVDDGFDLLGPAVLMPELLQKMRLFILRSKVDITPVEDIRCLAVVGHSDPWLSGAGISLTATGQARQVNSDAIWLRCGPELVYAYARRFPPDILHLADNTADGAELAEVRLGRPQVRAGTSGVFTAHMLNLDRLGAISFQKGCYPGQEIVARTHNLGAPKRRMYGFKIADGESTSAGSGINSADGDEVGTVVRSAKSNAGSELLAVIRCESANAVLSLSATGTKLVRRPVPGEPGN